MMAGVGFDLEVDRAPRTPAEWRRPELFRISCAALNVPAYGSQLFYGWTPDGPALYMGAAELIGLWAALDWWAKFGWVIVTWNGHNFDFPVLAHNLPVRPERYDRVRLLHHVDLLFEFYMKTGYRVALAQLQMSERKTQGMDGEQAAILWATGRYWDILQYVRQDALVVSEVYRALQAGERLRWVTRAGKPLSMELECLTVAQAAAMAREEDVLIPWNEGQRREWLAARDEVLRAIEAVEGAG